MSDPVGERNSILLEKLMEVEEERERLRTENADLKLRIEATMRGAINEAKGNGGSKAPYRRNYGAMTDEKLMSAVVDLETQQGDAHERVLARGDDPSQHLAKAQRIARERGLQ